MQTVIKAALTAHKTRWLLVGLLCLALWPKLAAAQSPELMEAYNRHVALYQPGPPARMTTVAIDAGTPASR